MELRAQSSAATTPTPSTGRGNLAAAYLDAGRAAEAIPIAARTIAQAQEAKLGPDHPDTLISRNNLAEAYRTPAAPPTPSAIARGDAPAAGGEAGPDHPNTLISRNNLAVAYLAAGRTRRRHRAARGDAQRCGVEARARPPRHAHQPQQPRRGLLRRRPHDRGHPH